MGLFCVTMYFFLILIGFLFEMQALAYFRKQKKCLI